jgi:hypothetical protein
MTGFPVTAEPGSRWRYFPAKSATPSSCPLTVRWPPPSDPRPVGARAVSSARPTGYRPRSRISCTPAGGRLPRPIGGPSPRGVHRLRPGGRLRAAHRVRQRRQPAAGARSRPRPRDVDPAVDGSQPWPPGRPGARRKCAPGGGGRRRWPGVVRGRCPSLLAFASETHPPYWLRFLFDWRIGDSRRCARHIHPVRPAASLQTAAQTS